MGDLKGFTMGRFRQGSIFRHVAAVTERVIFIGFTAQIGLGAVWMCINFDKVQDFGWGNLGRSHLLRRAAAVRPAHADARRPHDPAGRALASV